MMRGCVGLDDDEDARRHALADRVVDHALARQDAAILARHQHLHHVVAVGARPVHAGHVGHQAGGVGDRRHLDHGLGAVDELDQHARVHVPPLRLLAIVVGDGVVVERVVLALAGGDDRVAERGGELDQLHAARRLVAGADRIDDAQPVGLAFQQRADGDVGLDVHHHQVLAVLHRHQVEVGGDARLAGGVDHHVDERVLDQQLVGGDGDAARLDGAGDRRRRVGLGGLLVGAVGDAHGGARRVRAARRHRRDLDAAHQHALGDQVGAHLAGADDADAHGAALVGASGEVPGEPGEGDGAHAKVRHVEANCSNGGGLSIKPRRRIVATSTQAVPLQKRNTAPMIGPCSTTSNMKPSSLL